MLRLEHSTFFAGTYDYCVLGADAGHVHVAEAKSSDYENEVAWNMSSVRHVARLRQRIRSPSGGNKSTMPAGLYAITGGLGGLGLRAATLISSFGVRHVILASRSGIVPRNKQGPSWRCATTRQGVHVVTSDSSDPYHVEMLNSHNRSLVGILHAAGMAEPEQIVARRFQQLQCIFAPKVGGAWFLYRSTIAHALESYILFSSVASGLGNPFAGSYAAANGSLDGIALALYSHARPGCSLQWPAVSGAGMSVEGLKILAQTSMRSSGTASITLEQYASCLRHQLSVSPSKSSTMVHLNVTELFQDLWDMSAPRFRELALLCSPTACSFLATVSSSSRNSIELVNVLANVPSAERGTYLELVVLRVVGELTDTIFEMESPLMEAGIDSLAATELSSKLCTITGLALSPTLVFEQPTPRSIAAHIGELLVVTVGGHTTCVTQIMPEGELTMIDYLHSRGLADLSLALQQEGCVWESLMQRLCKFLTYHPLMGSFACSQV